MPKPRSKVSLALRISPELAAEVREFCRDEAGSPLFLTLSGLAEEALRLHLERLRAEVEGRTTTARRTTPFPNHKR